MPFILTLLDKLTEKPPFCSVVIAAAGLSTRMRGVDKLFAVVGGAPALAYTLLAFENNSSVNEIIVAAHSDKFGQISELCKQYGINKAEKIIEGGQTRTESVFNGVLAASKKARIIAIHDGARICVDNGVISRGIAAVSKYPAAAPGIPVSSTIKRVVKGIVQETVDREDLFEIQTPQVFKAEVIKVALTKTLKETDSITDDCIAVERMGLPVHIFEGSRSNIKLTTLEDILIAETILQTQGNRPMVFE